LLGFQFPDIGLAGLQHQATKIVISTFHDPSSGCPSVTRLPLHPRLHNPAYRKIGLFLQEEQDHII